MMGTTEAAQDISFAAMKEKQEQVVKTVMADPAVQAVGSFFGGGTGSAMNNARMFISLKPKGWGKDEREEDAETVIARLRGKALQNSRVPNCFSPPARTSGCGGRSSKAQYQYALSDQNIDELNSWAPKLVNKLQEYPQIKDATSDQQFRGLQETVVIDRDAAARLGIQPQAVDSTLYSAFGQRQVSIIYTQQNQYHVILEVDPQFYLDPSSLDKIYVKSNSGSQVPLSTIAHYQLDNTPLSVNHQGQFPCVTVSFNLAQGVSLGEATQIVERAKRESGNAVKHSRKFCRHRTGGASLLGDNAVAAPDGAARRLHYSGNALRELDSPCHHSFDDTFRRTRRASSHATCQTTNSISCRSSGSFC